MLVRSALLVEIISLAAVLLITFVAYRPQLQKKALENAVATGKALSTQIDITLSAVSGYGDFYVHSIELSNTLEDYARDPGKGTYDAVCRVLTLMQPAGNVHVRSVFILYGDTAFVSEAGLMGGDELMLAADWFGPFREGTQEVAFTPFYPSAETAEDDSVMCLRIFQLAGRSYVLGLIFPTDTLVPNIQILSDGLFSGYALATIEGPAFYLSGDVSNGRELLSARAHDGDFSHRDETGYYVVSKVSDTWKVLGFLSNAAFNSSFNSVLNATLLMCLLVCALALIMTVPTSGRIVAPVGVLRDAMSRATEGNMTARAEISADNEIGQLGDYFNNMLDQISASRENEREADRREQQMRYSLLTSQINTHYIYNTMSSINSLARMGRTDDVVKVNSALARILQSNLCIEGEAPFTTVREELDTINDYWSIESIRPNNCAVLSCQVPEEVWDAAILRNILQPLLENSLRHGLTDESTGSMSGEIRLSIMREGDELVIIVSDDGNGIAPETLRRLNSPDDTEREPGRHIGISNIRRRLALAFGERAVLEITSDGTTRVCIRCPSRGASDPASE